MEGPLNPLENQGPLDNQYPLDDPLLDALEHSIENPPGFVDPLAEPDKPLMDNLAKQLHEVEAGIENAPPILPKPDTVNDGNEPNVQSDESATSGVPSPGEDSKSPENPEDVWGTFQSSPPLPQEGAARAPPPNPPLPRSPRKGGGSIRPRRRLPLRVRLLGRAGRTIGGVNSYLRFCPESHEIIDTQQCEKCEKYRHWPEGTNEEPKECWYYPEAEPRSDESDDNSNEGS